jgi:glucosylceramidase
MKNSNRTIIAYTGLGLSLAFLGSACGTSPTGPGGSSGGAVSAGGTGVPPMGGGATVGGNGPAMGGGSVGGGGNNVGGTGQSSGGSVLGNGGGDPGAGGAGPDAGGSDPGAGGTSPGAGGDSAGTGGGSTTGDPLPKPKLITSAQGAFWKTDVEPTMGGTNATITVDPNSTLQDWIGWGGTFNERGWAELMKLNQADRDMIMKLLFSRADGLGLDYGRIPIGASDYALNRYTLCDAPCNATNLETEFSIERDKDPDSGLIPYIKAAQAVVAGEKAQYQGIKDVIFWGSAWTPPPWMKTNNAYDKGVMKNDTTTRKAYAKYLRLWVEAYGEEGIPIDHVYPQNEPGWAQAYPSCAWGPFTDGSNADTSTPAFMGSFVLEDLIPELSAAGLSTKVWYGTLSNNNHFAAYWGNLTDKSKVGGVGMQWAAIASLGTATGSGKPVMQSEHMCGNYPWLGTTCDSEASCNENSFWAARAPNNYNYAIESWGLFKDWIDGGANGYSAWNMVLDHVGRNLDEQRPWPQNALISFRQDGSINITPYYYVYRHVAQYAEPGGKRIRVTGGNALAFKNPDGSVMVAMYNSGAAQQVTLSIGGTMMQFMAPNNGWATVNWVPPTP